jgi:NADPH2:quinone reductase
MRAASYSEFGSARDVLKVGEVKTPEPRAGEVRVRLATSGVNPSDVKQRARAVARSIAFPVVPHSDGAGIIDAVGEGVAEDRIGERVWTYNAQFMRSNGTAAEYVTLPEDQAVRLEDNTSFAAGACFGIPALTAHRAVSIFGPLDGLTVLVQGGAGAVGHYAIQFAKSKGARVFATVSSDIKAAHATRGGAEHAINYKSENLAERIKEITGGAGVDRIVELAFSDNAPTYQHILARRGKVSIYGASNPTTTIAAQPFLAIEPTLRFVSVYRLDPEPRGQAIEDLSAMCRAGTLVHTIAARFSLEDIAGAHELVESGSAMGNVILDIADLGWPRRGHKA